MSKIALILLSLLLVGCFATSQIYHLEKNTKSDDIDKKLQVLAEQEKRLKELQQEFDRKINESRRMSERLEQDKIVARPPILSLPSPLPSVVRTTPPNNSNEPVGSGNPNITPQVIQKPKINVDHISVADQLYSANAIFAMPNNANIYEEVQAQLIIDPIKTLDELKTQVTAGPIKSAESIKISKIVIAKLEAPDFDIISSTDAEQAIVENEKTEWLWTLRPKTAGLHPVNIVVYAEVTVGSKTTKYRIRTFDKQIMIEITYEQIFLEWWQKYWQWFIVTLLLPFGKWLYDKKYGNKKE